MALGLFRLTTFRGKWTDGAGTIQADDFPTTFLRLTTFRRLSQADDFPEYNVEMIKALAEATSQREKLAEFETKIFDLVQQLPATEDISEVARIRANLMSLSQKWFRGGSQFLKNHDFSSPDSFRTAYVTQQLSEITNSYYSVQNVLEAPLTQTLDKDQLLDFFSAWHRAKCILDSVLFELEMKAPSLIRSLKREAVQEEFDWARDILDQANGEQVLVRVSGSLARVALERLLLALVEKNNLHAILGRRQGSLPHAKADHLIETLSEGSVISSTEKKDLNLLFAVGNDCAHPKEINAMDVQKLVLGGPVYLSKLQ
jgi:hypothetical protein